MGTRKCAHWVAERALARFLDDKRCTENQIRVVNLIIDELTQQGVVEPGGVYGSPYDGIAPQGPEDLFSEVELEALFATIERLRPEAQKP